MGVTSKPIQVDALKNFDSVRYACLTWDLPGSAEREPLIAVEGAWDPMRELPGAEDIRGWQSMSKGQAAQAVQVSAFPELCARWEPEATAIVDALDGGTASALCTETSSSAPKIPESANLSESRKDILRFAKEGIGGAYVWGGTAFKAWDCSGLVQWIYRQAGIDLPRVEQWRVGIRTDSPQPGDLVVQNAQGPNNWGHVGIYAGDGLMWSALNPAVGTLLHPVAWNSDTAYFDLLT